VAANDERSSRLLNLVTALQDTSVPLSADEIRERVPGYTAGAYESFRRTFERDKDDLRRMGVEIEVVELLAQDPPTSGYRIRRDRYELPDPGLTPVELASLVAATRVVNLIGTEVGDPADGFRKLGGFGDGAADAAPGPVEVEVPAALVDVFDGVLDRRLLQFPYNDSDRTVEPHRVHFERGHWYLLAWDRSVEDRRTFRVDRIGGVRRGEPEAFERRPELGDITMRPWEYGDGPATEVRIRLDRVAAAALRSDEPELELLPVGDPTAGHGAGTCDVLLHVVDRRGLFHFLVSFLDRAEALEPPAVRADFVGWLEAQCGDGGVT